MVLNKLRKIGIILFLLPALSYAKNCSDTDYVGPAYSHDCTLSLQSSYDIKVHYLDNRSDSGQQIYYDVKDSNGNSVVKKTLAPLDNDFNITWSKEAREISENSGAGTVPNDSYMVTIYGLHAYTKLNKSFDRSIKLFINFKPSNVYGKYSEENRHAENKQFKLFGQMNYSVEMLDNLDGMVSFSPNDWLRMTTYTYKADICSDYHSVCQKSVSNYNWNPIIQNTTSIKISVAKVGSYQPLNKTTTKSYDMTYYFND